MIGKRTKNSLEKNVSITLPNEVIETEAIVAFKMELAEYQVKVSV